MEMHMQQVQAKKKQLVNKCKRKSNTDTTRQLTVLKCPILSAV